MLDKCWLNQINSNRTEGQHTWLPEEGKGTHSQVFTDTYHPFQTQTKISYNNVTVTHQKQDQHINNEPRSNLTDKSQYNREHAQ